MDDWKSIPRDRGPNARTRYPFDWKGHKGRIIFTLILFLISIGLLISPSPRGTRADSNVNMTQDQFNAGYQNAQNNNWFTGNWGTARFYIAGSDMYVSGGQLQGRLMDIVGLPQVHRLNSINFTAHAQTPQDSTGLLAADDYSNNYNVSLHYLNGLSNLDTSQTNNMTEMFDNDTSLTRLDGIQNWNTSNVNDTNFMFTNDNHLQNLGLSNWNMGQVTNMNSMFEGLASLNDLGDISHWDTHNVQDMGYMFDNDISLTRLELDHWNTGNVTELYNMFANTTSLSDLNIKEWNTTNVTNMSDMFHGFDGSESLQKINLSGWQTPSLTDMSNMFNNEADLREVDLNQFDTRNANTNCAFLQAPGLNHLVTGNDTTFGNVFYIPGFGWQNGSQILGHDQLSDGNAHPGNWVRTSFADSYYDASQKGYWGTAPWYIDSNHNMHVGNGQLLGNLNNTIGYSNSHSINSVNFDGNVQAPQDSSWLLAASSGFGDNNYNLQAINGTQNIDTSQVRYMGDMFSNDMVLKNLDLSNWDTSNVVDMNSIFDADQSLQSLNVSDWNVSNVQNLSWSFYLNSLSNLDLSGWHTNSVNDMEEMFDNDKSLQSLDLSNFNTSQVNNMTGMYDNDNLLSQISLGSRTKNTPLADTALVSNNWQNGNQVLDSTTLQNNDSHPGTWSTDAFMANFHQAQRNNQSTGFWGTAPWYIDSNHNMHVGAGQLQGHLYDAIGSSNASQIQSINFDESIKAPQDSSFLLSTSNRGIMGSTNLQSINGLDKIDTSSVQSMNNIFSNDAKLTNLDLTSWDLNNVKDLSFAFWDNYSLSNLNISDWDTSNISDMNDMFDVTKNLYHLNLGNRTYLKAGSQVGLSVSKDNATSFTSGNQVVTPRQLEDGNAHPGDWKPSQFFIDYQNAQKQGWTTGSWGSAPYYIDNGMNMHVGDGQLQNPLYDVVGDDVAHNLKTINLDEPAQAPENGLDLFSGRNYHLGEDTDVNQSITAINGLDKLDVSDTSNFHDMFYRDTDLNSPMNIDGWNTSHVNDMGGMFGNTNIPSFDIHDWNVSNNTTTGWMFFNDYALQNLNLDNWHTDNLDDSTDTFSGDMNLKTLNVQNFKTGKYANSILFGMDGQIYTGPAHDLEQMTLGNETRFNERSSYFPGATWTNGKDLLSRDEMDDGNPHPGSWYLTPFAKNYRYAKQHGWQYGTWGTAPWYIDDQGNMHVGKGQLQGSLNSIVPNDRHHIQSIDIDEPVQAPQDSTGLFAETQGFMDNDYTLHNINGLEKVDTSQATNMNAMFYNDLALNHLNVSNWDTRHVQNFTTMFTSDNSLTDLQGIQNWNVQAGQNFSWMFYGAPWSQLDLSDWHTPSATDMEAMFEAAGNLSDLNISNFDTTHAKTQHMFGNDTDYHLPSDRISTVDLGAKTTLQSDSGLTAGIWGSNGGFLDTFQLMDSNPHPGSWNYYPVRTAPDITGTTDDRLNDLIGRDLNLPNGDNRIQIINGQNSQDGQGNLQEGNYPDITFTHVDANGNPTFYRANLSVHRYYPGPDVSANVGQTTDMALSNAVGSNTESAVLDDDGGSTSDGTHLQYGDYTIKYHYQDRSGAEHYAQSKLHVGQSTLADYLYINGNDTSPSDGDYMNSIAPFLGIDPATVHLNEGTGLPGQKGYVADADNQRFSGNVQTVPKMNKSLSMAVIPGASDSTWDYIVGSQFTNDMNYGFDVNDNHIDSFTTDGSTGSVEIKGTVHPVNTSFANDPAIPYDFHITPPMTDYSIDNTVNDKQVQDVIDSIDSSSRVAKVLDGQGADVTGSFGELSTIPQDSHVTVTVDTGHGYVNLHFAHISNLVEPNVDVAHDSATDGSDISKADLQSQIRDSTHENSLNGFSIDSSQQVSPDVKEVNYHFVKDTVATGNSLDVKTTDNQVSGTAYVHYTNDDTSSTPTFTVTQGSNPLQHIEAITGHTVRITQAPSDANINNLPVGNYDLTYQYSDIGDDSTNFHANITVIPNYYFSPVTNDTNFNNPDQEAGYFKSDDYQSNGSSYKSVVDTQDHSKEDNSQNGSNDNSSNSSDFTIDGLHTQDGKPAHFDSNNPYDK